MSQIVVSSVDIAKGKTYKNGGHVPGGTFIAPLQFLPLEEKDEEWRKNNADYWEWQALLQIFSKAERLSKNYNMAKGIIDKNDYFPTTATPENRGILDQLVEPAMDRFDDVKFYPLIPTFVNSVVSEFAKRTSKVTFQAVDEFSRNEVLDAKKEEIGRVLIKEAHDKILQSLIDAGHDPEDPQDAELFQQQLSDENIRSLPQIQEYYDHSYRSLIEEWAAHQMEYDNARFDIEQLEERNFRNSVVTDQEYWHFRMLEDDYMMEIWNPIFTAVFKSPESRFTSQAYAAINVTLMTVPDVIDTYGYIMNEEQQKSLERVYSRSGAKFLTDGYDRESYYDKSLTPEQNNEYNLETKKLMASVGEYNNSILNTLMNYHAQTGENYMVRVSTGYWKTQRRVGKLTEVMENGEIYIDVVDESYLVTNKPAYDKTFTSAEVPETLIYGQHIDWTWIPQTWGFVKIGPNIPSWNGMPGNVTISAGNGLTPIYLGINQNLVSPLKYQFKGDMSLYGCKIPVEGATFTDYNTRSSAAVELLAPYQISFNVVNNQINDILMDELGTVVAFDHNLLPKESLGQDWGPHNYAKAYTAMRTFNMLPLDRKLQNTESGASSQAPVQMLNLAQTERLRSRIELANYFKNEGLASVGITPPRLGQAIGRQTATGVEENLNASYNQTEHLFIQHSDWLMPRVHQMRTDLAQFYNSTKPSVRLSYTNTREQKINFELNGVNWLSRDFNVNPSSRAENRSIIDNIKKRLLSDNTLNTPIYDLAPVMAAKSLGELMSEFEKIRRNAQQQAQQDHDRQLEIQKQEQDAAMQEKLLEFDHESREAEKNRRKDVLVAEIRAAGYSGSVDLNDNAQNDFLDNLDRIQSQQEFQDQMSLERDKEGNRADLARQQQDLKREEMANKLRLKEMDVNIARVNQNQYDLKSTKKKQQAKKKK